MWLKMAKEITIILSGYSFGNLLSAWNKCKDGLDKSYDDQIRIIDRTLFGSD